jgi:hypothetical protein
LRLPARLIAGDEIVLERIEMEVALSVRRLRLRRPDIVPVEVHATSWRGTSGGAAQPRALSSKRAVLALNLMGSPGSGKTAALEATAMPRLRTSSCAWEP